MKKLTLFKKVLIAYISCIVLIILSCSIYSNLKVHAVYYAKHTPHADGIHPEIIEAVENLSWNAYPKQFDVYYDFDGYPSIHKSMKSGLPCFARESLYPKGLEEFFYIDLSGRFYRLTGDLEIISEDSDSTGYELGKNNAKKEKIKREVHELIDPVIDAQPEPGLLNLQWLYDLLNHQRFNS